MINESIIRHVTPPRYTRGPSGVCYVRMCVRVHPQSSSRAMDSLDVFYGGDYEPHAPPHYERDPPACRFSRTAEPPALYPETQFAPLQGQHLQPRQFDPCELPLCQHVPHEQDNQAGFGSPEKEPDSNGYRPVTEHNRPDEERGGGGHAAISWRRALRTQPCQAPVPGEAVRMLSHRQQCPGLDRLNNAYKCL